MGFELVVRIREKGAKGQGCYSYKNEINLEDFKQLATLLGDLEMYNAKIEKAFIEFKKKKETWPFE